MARGGKREGAGRTLGAPNKITQEAREKALQGGISPLDYMLEVMRTSIDPEVRLDAAKAAAPYVHPRITSVQGGEKPVDVSLSVQWANPEE